MNPLLVSIIMPLHNTAPFVQQAIASVQAQTFSAWELWVVDDASSDHGASLVAELAAQDTRIHLLQLQHNQGAASARNHALTLAQGRYIAFLDSDDEWLPHKLEVQLQWMREQQIAFCFSAYEKINAQGEHLGWVGVPYQVGYQQLLKTCVIGCLTVIYDTQVFGKVPMPNICRRQDFGLWLDLLKRVDYAVGLQQPLARYRVHEHSLSAKKSIAAYWTWRLMRDVEQLHFCKAVYYFSHYAVRGLLRHRYPRIARWLGVLNH